MGRIGRIGLQRVKAFGFGGRGRKTMGKCQERIGSRATTFAR